MGRVMPGTTHRANLAYNDYFASSRAVLGTARLAGTPPLPTGLPPTFSPSLPGSLRPSRVPPRLLLPPVLSADAAFSSHRTGHLCRLALLLSPPPSLNAAPVRPEPAAPPRLLLPHVGRLCHPTLFLISPLPRRYAHAPRWLAALDAPRASQMGRDGIVPCRAGPPC